MLLKFTQTHHYEPDSQARASRAKAILKELEIEGEDKEDSSTFRIANTDKHNAFAVHVGAFKMCKYEEMVESVCKHLGVATATGTWTLVDRILTDTLHQKR